MKGAFWFLSFGVVMVALGMAIELSQEQHEHLPDFGDPKV
jgi:hypothetical protein